MMRAEKQCLPYVVFRVNAANFTPDDPSWTIRVLSIFDEETAARDEVRRLEVLNAEKGEVYLVQRAKKYFRGGGVCAPDKE